MLDHHSEQSAAVALPAVPGHDYFLAALVYKINISPVELEVGITLSISGSRIAGQLIKRRSYFDLLAQTYERQIDRNDPAQAGLLAAFAQAARETGHTVYDQSRNQPSPWFIHLRDARWIGETGRPCPAEGCLWRGRLNEVSGFSLDGTGEARPVHSVKTPRLRKPAGQTPPLPGERPQDGRRASISLSLAGRERRRPARGRIEVEAGLDAEV